MKKLILTLLMASTLFACSCAKAQDITVTQIEADTIKNSHITQFDTEGAYMIDNGDDAVIFFVRDNSEGYSASAHAEGSDVIVSYFTGEGNDDSELMIDEKAYLIDKYPGYDNSNIKLYKNSQEVSFVDVTVISGEIIE